MSEHPDLDALSAHLDAEGDLSAHLDGCPQCRARLEPLRASRDAVAQPVPGPTDAVRERTIAAALDAADWLPATVTTPRAPSAAAPSVPAAPPAPPAPSVPAASAPSRSRWWLGGSAVAAVLALVVGAMALVNREGHDTTGTALSAGPPAAESAGSGATGSGATGATGDASTSAKSAAGPATGELGDVTDVNALRALIVGQRNTTSAQPVSPPPQVASGNAASQSLSGTSAAASEGASAPAPVQVGTRVCEEQARTARPQLGVVVYAANLRYAGAPAIVLGFAAKTTDPPATLLVLAPGQGCRVLVETTPS
jgi:hypothetical protein